MMEENLKFDLTKIEKEKRILYFKKMIKILEENASEQDVPVEKVINDFISDLSNIGKEGYERKVKNIGLRISKETLSNCIKYMKRESKRYKQIADNDKKKTRIQQKKDIWQEIEENIDRIVLQGKQGTKKEIVQKLIEGIESGEFEYEFKSKEKKFVLKKLKGIVSEIKKEEEAKAEEKRKQEEEKRKQKEERRRQEEEKRKAEEAEAEEKRRQEEARRNVEVAINQIQERAEREYKSGRVESRLEVLNKIRDAITGEGTGIDLGAEMGEASQEYLLEMLDGKIKDEVYYEQVKKFTDNFQFLSEEEMRYKGARGRMVKFTDSYSSDKYYSLRSQIQKGHDEYLRINELLKSDKLDNIDRKILTARKDVLDKEIERKSKIEGIR